MRCLSLTTNWKTLLLSEAMVESTHVEQFARLLASIHEGGCQHREAISDDFDDRTLLRVSPTPAVLRTCRRAGARGRRLLWADLIKTPRGADASRWCTVTSAPRTCWCSRGDSYCSIMKSSISAIRHSIWGSPSVTFSARRTTCLSFVSRLRTPRGSIGGSMGLRLPTSLGRAILRFMWSVIPWAACWHEWRVSRHWNILTSPKRRRQQTAASRLINNVPSDVESLTRTFLKNL